MSKIKKQILNNSIVIYNKRTISQHLYNDTYNKDHLKFEVKSLLLDSIKDELQLVSIEQQYPVNDIQDIVLETDFIIIDRKTFDNIIDKE